MLLTDQDYDQAVQKLAERIYAGRMSRADTEKLHAPNRTHLIKKMANAAMRDAKIFYEEALRDRNPKEPLTG